MTRRSLRRRARILLMLCIRYTPLPWDVKWWLIWAASVKVTLSACALIDDGSARLLVLRSLYTGRWQLPGGNVNRGEAPLAALRRECREELGLAVLEPRLVTVQPEGRGIAQIALYTCSLAPGRLRLSEEHTAYAYLPPAELPPNLRRLLRALASEQRLQQARSPGDAKG